MNQRTALLSFVLLVLVVVLFGLVYVLGRQFVPVLMTEEGVPQEASQITIGQKAPYFDLPNTKGNRVRLSDYIGRPVVVVFWATWESSSIDQMHIIDTYKAKPDTHTIADIVLINSQEDKSVVNSLLRRGGYQVDTLYDVSGTVTENYEARSLPVAYFIDSEGIVRSVFVGVMNNKTLADKIETIL